MLQTYGDVQDLSMETDRSLLSLGIFMFVDVQTSNRNPGNIKQSIASSNLISFFQAIASKKRAQQKSYQK